MSDNGKGPGQGGPTNGRSYSDSTDPLDTVIAKLRANGFNPQQTPFGWYVDCPNHHVGRARISTGTALDPQCVAADPCKQEQLIDALGLRELFPNNTRRVDLGPYLDGTFKAPTPSVGGIRDDGITLLYPGLWHTCIALTTAGKSWFALWHAIQVMRSGGTVTYAHFEESSPAGTLARLRGIAPDLAPEKIQEQFIWLDCTTRWTRSEFAANLPNPAALVVLDGINAACSQHGWPVDKTDSVGDYRGMFVTPATKTGAAVLSRGHPPKSRDRQSERHGFGSTAWLDEVDGVGFRLEASKTDPIQLGTEGHSRVYTVKDRWAQVQQHGKLQADREGGWYYLGSFKVDSSPSRDNTVAFMTAPSPEGWGEVRKDSIDVLADDIMETLRNQFQTTGNDRFESANKMAAMLRAREIQFSQNDLSPALMRLANRQLIEWPEVKPRQSRPGWIRPEAVVPVPGTE